MKTCPACAEQIQDEAVKCPYCHEKLTRCPYCAEWIQAGAVICRFCGESRESVPAEEELPELFELSEEITPSRMITGFGCILVLGVSMVVGGILLLPALREVETGGFCDGIPFMLILLGLLLVGVGVWFVFKAPGNDWVECLNCEKAFWIKKGTMETKCPKCGQRGIITRLTPRRR